MWWSNKRGKRLQKVSPWLRKDGGGENVGEGTKTRLFLLCYALLSQHAHSLICGFTHNHATFPTRLTNGFHAELPGSQSSKSPSQKPSHTQEHSHIVGNHLSIKDNLCFQTETSKRLFKTVPRCVKRERKKNIFSSVVCFAAALWTNTAVYNQTECFTGHSQG